MLKIFIIVLGGFWLASGTIGFNSAYGASDDVRLQAMQQELDSLRQQVADVSAQQDEDWLTERRAEEIKGLIHEVLTDADMRASFAEDGLNAGYDGGFYITDGEQFLLKFNSYVQFRYIGNFADDLPNSDVGGFQTRRLGTMFSGYIGQPRITYLLLVTYSRASGDSTVEMAKIGYKFDDTWSVQAGQFKAPFQREWMTSCRKMQAVERSYINFLFTSLYTQGVELTGKGDDTRLILAFTDGSFGWNTDFDADRTEYSFNVRGEWKVIGDWKQFGDTMGWSQDKTGLLIGTSFQYDKGDRNNATELPDVAKYSIDAGLEGTGWNVFAAFTGQHIEGNGAATLEDADQWGFLIQAGVFIIPDKLDIFARGEWAELDGVYFKQSSGTITATDEDDPHLITVGCNYYLNGNAVKLTLDVVHAPRGLPARDSGAGLRASSDDQTAIRAQATVSF